MRLFTPCITPYSLLAVLGWVVSIAIVLADLLVFSADDFGHVGIVIAAGSAVLNVKGMFHKAECREREVFQLGRDSVTQMRR